MRAKNKDRGTSLRMTSHGRGYTEVDYVDVLASGIGAGLGNRNCRNGIGKQLDNRQSTARNDCASKAIQAGGVKPPLLKTEAG